MRFPCFWLHQICHCQFVTMMYHKKRRNGKIKLKKNNKIIEKRFDHTLGIFANKFDCACANNEIFPVLRKVLTEVPIRQNQSAEQLRNTYI